MSICKHNKIAFLSKAEAISYINMAKASLRRGRKRKNEARPKLKTYHCQWCNQWHLTTRTRKEYKNAVKKHRREKECEQNT